MISNCFLFFKQDEDVKRVFLPPPAYRPYTPNKLDSPHLSTHKAYLSDSRSFIDDDREASWQYEGTQSIYNQFNLCSENTPCIKQSCT